MRGAVSIALAFNQVTYLVPSFLILDISTSHSFFNYESEILHYFDSKLSWCCCSSAVHYGWWCQELKPSHVDDYHNHCRSLQHYCKHSVHFLNLDLYYLNRYSADRDSAPNRKDVPTLIAGIRDCDQASYQLLTSTAVQVNGQWRFGTLPKIISRCWFSYTPPDGHRAAGWQQQRYKQQKCHIANPQWPSSSSVTGHAVDSSEVQDPPRVEKFRWCIHEAHVRWPRLCSDDVKARYGRRGRRWGRRWSTTHLIRSNPALNQSL